MRIAIVALFFLSLLHFGSRWAGFVRSDSGRSVKVGNNFFHYYLGAKYPQLGYLDFYSKIARTAEKGGLGHWTPRDLRHLAKEEDVTSTHYLLLIGRYFLPFDQALRIPPNRRESFWREYFDPRLNRNLRRDLPRAEEGLRNAALRLKRHEERVARLLGLPPDSEAFPDPNGGPRIWQIWADRMDRLIGISLARLSRHQGGAQAQVFLDQTPPQTASVTAQLESLTNEVELLLNLTEKLPMEAPGSSNPPQPHETTPTPSVSMDMAPWEANMAADLRFMQSHGADLPRYVQDHGYNATPFWTFLARRLPMVHQPLSAASYLELVSLDLLLMTLILVVGAAVFGLSTEAGLLLATWFLFQDTLRWFDGSLLRHDWLFGSTLAALLVKKRRPALAGIALGLSSLIRVFPLLPLFGIPLALLLEDERSKRKDALRMFAGGALTLAAGIALGRLGGDWNEWAEKIGSQFSGTYSAGNNASVRFLWALLIDRFRWFSPFENEMAFDLSRIQLWIGLVWAYLWWKYLRKRAPEEQLAAWLVSLPLLLGNVLNYYCLGSVLAVAFLIRQKARISLGLLAALTALPYLGYPMEGNMRWFWINVPYALVATIALRAIVASDNPQRRAIARYGKNPLGLASK